MPVQLLILHFFHYDSSAYMRRTTPRKEGRKEEGEEEAASMQLVVESRMKLIWLPLSRVSSSFNFLPSIASIRFLFLSPLSLVLRGRLLVVLFPSSSFQGLLLLLHRRLNSTLIDVDYTTHHSCASSPPHLGLSVQLKHIPAQPPSSRLALRFLLHLERLLLSFFLSSVLLPLFLLLFRLSSSPFSSLSVQRKTRRTLTLHWFRTSFLPSPSLVSYPSFRPYRFCLSYLSFLLPQGVCLYRAPSFCECKLPRLLLAFLSSFFLVVSLKDSLPFS